MLALVGPCLTLATPAAKLIQCATVPSLPGCSFPPAPDVFDARFSFGSSGNATLRITSSWCPVYANLFWKLILLGFYSETPPFRVDYRNATHAFMAQMGWNLQEGVQGAWDTHRAIAQAVPATESNTRGRVAMSMQATTCNASAAVDPCAQYRPACTAADYCAHGGSTQFFISYGNNSRLDAHGFAPFGEVIQGMETIDTLGRVLGNAYGEMTDLCPTKPTPDTSAYCIYSASAEHLRRGVAGSELAKPGAEAYVRGLFPLMYEARVRSVEVVAAAAP